MVVFLSGEGSANLQILWLTSHTFVGVYCFFLTNSPLYLLKPHTSFSNFRRGTSVSLNYWCRSTLKVTLRLSRHIRALTQLTYVSIIVSLYMCTLPNLM